MRALLPLVAAAALVALAPAAQAAAFEVEAGRLHERALVPGGDATFDVGVLAAQDGFLYAKILPTPGNAVHDGTTPNGSVEEGTGWRVSFAVERADGTREELGTFVTSAMTRLVPVAAGEQVRLVATTHAPDDALAEGGPTQRVHVALAYRAEAAGAGPGGASGASMDEAVALTLLHTSVLAAPPAPAEEPPAEDPGPVAPLPEESAAPATAQAVPTWFLVGVLVLLSAIALLLLAGVLLLAEHVRRQARAQEPAPPVAERARTIPVHEAGARAPAPRAARDE